MSPDCQQLVSCSLTWADMGQRDHGWAYLGTYLA